ncbi:hypothetical protein [Georgenia thermotolerans]|uniref:hypothetical protein n=1 Tax=Georgenia thermotolerans TaxID=527326 RepID=UPI00186B5374|nr:hypothetical protein [Georgenia thermotolerans]
MTAYTEWTAQGEENGEGWIAELNEYTRDEAEAYVKRHGGYLMRREVTEWERVLGKDKK